MYFLGYKLYEVNYDIFKIRCFHTEMPTLCNKLAVFHMWSFSSTNYAAAAFFDILSNYLFSIIVFRS
jgi:hypothetical protein